MKWVNLFHCKPGYPGGNGLTYSSVSLGTLCVKWLTYSIVSLGTLCLKWLTYSIVSLGTQCEMIQYIQHVQCAVYYSCMPTTSNLGVSYGALASFTAISCYDTIPQRKHHGKCKLHQKRIYCNSTTYLAPCYERRVYLPPKNCCHQNYVCSQIFNHLKNKNL